MYEIKFRPTLEHSNADGLSRLPLQVLEEDEEGRETSVLSVQQETLPVMVDQLRNATRYDLNGWPEAVPEILQPFYTHQEELLVENDTLLWGIRVIITGKLREKVLQELHDNHPGMSKMKALARSHVWWPQIDKEIEQYVGACLVVKASPPLAPLHPWVWPTRPFQRVHIDFAGPLCGEMFCY